MALGADWFLLPGVCSTMSPAASPAQEEFVLVLYWWLTGALLVAHWCVLMPQRSYCGCAEEESKKHKKRSPGPFRSLEISVSLCQIWKLLKRLKPCLLVHMLLNARNDLLGFASLKARVKINLLIDETLFLLFCTLLK